MKGWLILGAALLVVSLWLRLGAVWDAPMDYDEGHWLMFGALVNAGHPAYSETFVGIPPLALLTIQLGEYLFGPTLAARYPMMVWSLPGVAALLWVWRGRKWAAGVVAALLLSCNHRYFYDSATIMAEVPAVSLAVLALVLACRYGVGGRRRWLFLSGVAFGLSLALKIFVVFLPPLILLAVYPHPRPPTYPHPRPLSQRERGVTLPPLSPWERGLGGEGKQGLGGEGLLWLAGVAIPTLLWLALYPPAPMYEQVVAFRFAMREYWAERMNLGYNLRLIGTAAAEQWPLLIGAGAGLVIGRRQQPREAAIWSGWLLLALATLLWQVPLRERYGVVMVPALAALCGLAVSGGRWPARLGAILLLAWTAGAPLGSLLRPPTPDTFPGLNLAAVQYVWRHTTPDDCIVTDDQRFAFAAARLTPPWLSETSRARLNTGRLTEADMVRDGCPVVAYADGIFTANLPQLEARLRERYLLELRFDEKTILYAAPKNIARRPDHPMEARLGETILLEGFDLTPAPWRPGTEVRLATYWRAVAPPTQGYKIFVQLRNRQGEVVAGFDHFPFPPPDGDFTPVPHFELGEYPPAEQAAYPGRGLLPTNAWPVGQSLREVIPLNLPPDLPATSYELYLGMYDPETGVRLPSPEPGDEVRLATIEVMETQ